MSSFPIGCSAKTSHSIAGNRSPGVTQWLGRPGLKFEFYASPAIQSVSDNVLIDFYGKKIVRCILLGFTVFLHRQFPVSAQIHAQRLFWFSERDGGVGNGLQTLSVRQWPL